jgi:hypothetical protein
MTVVKVSTVDTAHRPQQWVNVKRGHAINEIVASNALVNSGLSANFVIGTFA